jgi:hypothetical protein
MYGCILFWEKTISVLHFQNVAGHSRGRATAQLGSEVQIWFRSGIIIEKSKMKK